MTALGAPLTADKLSKIESGTRSVTIEELVMFATALDVPLLELLKPLDGEVPVRITAGWALDRGEVANWAVWGPAWSDAARGAQQLMRETLEIAFWMRAKADDPTNQTYTREVARCVGRIRDTVGLRPGVVRRRDVARTPIVTSDAPETELASG